MAAFSSVLRRTKNSPENPIRLKAAFNLGNTAYKIGDYASAAAFYRQLLLEDPSNEDARHNMELALRAIEKQKEEQKKQSEMDHPQDNQKGQDQKNQQQGEKKDSKESSKEQQDKSDQGKNEDQAKQDRQKGEEPQKDLKGELKPLQDLPQEEKKEQTENDAASVDKQRAEALLDNIKEDPARRLQFLIPEEKKRPAPSGKDW
jgi:Ca-activated chloride channel family protein